MTLDDFRKLQIGDRVTVKSLRWTLTGEITYITPGATSCIVTTDTGRKLGGVKPKHIEPLLVAEWA